ncbi:viral A-type inclusion protein [Barnesiella viscericola]|uniref:viral A-type inclusion protein n=1 Tax=Barnesiella viscericola TaxID=397865 RepID=UPI00320A6688
MAKPVEIEIIMKDRLSGGLDKAGRKVDELKGKTASANAELDKQAQKLRDSIALLENQMEELRRAGQNASPNLDQRENIAGIEVLQKQIAELEAQLKHLDATAESTQTIPPELPAAKQQFNGLHMSIQQMAREMPSLAMGPQMFFLAISNNLPIFADEVQRAKREYEGLVKAGQKGVPVWRQILSSLFSWQTALTTGIMLLVMYGDEIVDWVKGLFSAKEGVDALKKSLQEKNEVEKEGHAVSIRTRAELDNTIRELRDFIGTKEQEKNKVDELNRKYGDAFGSYKTLAEWYDVLIQKGNTYIESLFNQAKAQSYIKKAVEADEKANEIRSKGKEEYRPFWGNGGKLNMFLGGDNLDQYGSDPAETAFNKALQEVENEKQHYLNQAEWFQQEYSRIIKESGLSDYRPITPEAPADNSTKNQAEDRKQAQQRLNDELLALERQNQDEELDLMNEGTTKRLAQIDADYNKRKAEIEKTARELAELNKKAGVAGTNASGLTGRQQEEIDRANTLAEDTRDKERSAVYREEAAAMRDYLKEYGSYQQQKLAIAEEYAEKIRQAQSEGERLSLEKERTSAINRLELSAIQQQIDWGSVFGNFGVMFREQVQPTIDRLKAIAQSSEFQSSAGIDEKEMLYGLISNLQQSETIWDGEIFRRINDDLVAYQNAMRNYMAAQQREIEATEALTSAKEKLKEAESSGDARSIDAAELYVGEAAKNLDKASQDVQLFGAQVQSTTTDLRESSEQAASMFVNLESGIRNLSSGSLNGIGQGFMQLDKLFNGGKLTEQLGGSLVNGIEKLFGNNSVVDALQKGLGNSGFVGSIISAILSILDDLAEEGVGGIVSGLIDTVLGAISGIIENIFSLNIFRQIGESLLKGIANIFNALSFGGLGKLVGNGDSDPRLEEELEHLSSANEALAYSIDRLADEIKDTSGQDATDKYAEQMALIANSEGNTQEEMRRSGAAFTNGFLGIGGKHSSNYRIDQAMSDYDWQRISDVVGRTIDEAAGFWDLSSEEMAKVARDVPDLYAKVKNYASEGYKDAAQYMDDYIAFAEQRKELEQAYYESITQVSFDSVYDNFIDMLMDMSSGWEDFSNDMSEYLMRALLKTKLDELLKPDMEAWYKAYGEAMSDGILGDDEIERLNKMWEDLVNQGLEIRDSAASATGYTGDSNGTSQSGKSGGFTAMSQDQGTKLEGLFVSGQMHWSSMDDKMSDVSEQMGAAVDHLRRIEENTGTSARHLGEIKEDIKKIVRDGLKMK